MTELRPLELELIQSISEKASWQENTWVSVNSEAVKAKIRFFYLFIKKKKSSLYSEIECTCLGLLGFRWPLFDPVETIKSLFL